MRVVGIHIAKGQLRYSVLEGSKANPILVMWDRLLTPDPDIAPALMDWFETKFTFILDVSRSNRIAYRLTLKQKKDQLVTSAYPFGILNLLAHRRSIPIVSYVAGRYVASKLGLPKGSDIYAHCDTVLGSHPPYWDKNQKLSVLAAWFELT